MNSKRTAGAALLAASIFLLGGCATPSQMFADAEVKRLCAIDGGITVYETVRLPPEKFDQWGQINFYQPNQGENALGVEYRFKRTTTYIKQGDPDLFRIETVITSSRTGALIGKSVFYIRSGGDMPGPWPGTRNICPEPSIENDVVRQIFKQGF